MTLLNETHLENKMKKFEMRLGQAKMDRKNAQEACEKFAAELIKNPQYAMEWSDRVFTDAARVAVNDVVIHFLLNPKGDEEQNMIVVANHSMEFVMNAARFPETSSSTTSNVAKRCLLSVWAEISEVYNCKY